MSWMRAIFIGLSAIFAAGCTLVPNMDATGSGCQNQGGAGPRDQGEAPIGIPLAGIAGLTPSEAAAAAATAGHVTVFRLSSFACVCVPPAGYGPVAKGWWGQRGQLYLDLEAVEPQGAPLPDGTGC